MKLVKRLSANKTKIATYCNLADFRAEVKRSSGAGDNSSKLAQLGKQAGDVVALRPEFARLKRRLRTGKILLQGRAGVVSRARQVLPASAIGSVGVGLHRSPAVVTVWAQA
jgi:hypothetical protein